MRWARRRVVLAVAVVALVCTGCFGPGSYRVAPMTQPDALGRGVWRTLGQTGTGRCTAVEPDLGRGSAGAFVWSDLPGPRIIVVRGDETGFITEGCSPWFDVAGPFAVRLATPGEPFGQGDYFVGSEVEPGTYEARTLIPMGEAGWPSSCGWFRVVIDADLELRYVETGWAQADGVATATIDASDTYFGSRNCDQWTKVG